jgi:hypothetical protein
MVTDLQVRRFFAMQNRFEHLYQAADVAGISSKTARNYLKSKQLPSQCLQGAYPSKYHSGQLRTLQQPTDMTTAAAIDRLVHHSVILELNVNSYRAEQARKRKYKDK